MTSFADQGVIAIENGTAYRMVGDLTQAREVLEEGLEYARTRSGRRQGRVEGFLLNNLARVAYAQQDYRGRRWHAVARRPSTSRARGAG